MDIFSIQLNTIGTSECRKKYMQALEDFYVGKERSIPPEFRDLITKNPMRLLDKKDEELDDTITLDNFFTDVQKMTDPMSRPSMTKPAKPLSFATLA